ncbi:hypothetical protein J2X06_001844 [Lysobacter niastensis]|uniref:Uncharacterized protein n=1 Tax=Lysobacter niastensis TaxID=380629 RepID=A0ABU1WBC5_9GAMM|nr:hypothetical protein [Lysobacter niastensis]MDR7134635.1 hypothetical protein [Lysobacter niastensis]
MNAATALVQAQPWENPATTNDHQRYARCIQVSKRVRWDIDADVIRGRDFDYSHTFLPAGLSMVDALDFLDQDERRFLSQVQGRTYAYVFGLVERFIGAKMLQTSGQHWLGDQTALEALVRFSDEELKHQELFRRLEALMEARMPPGYVKVAEPNAVAGQVLQRRSWAVLGLISHIELFVQNHYEQSIAPQTELCPLWKDVFLFHWREESQHAILDELEWRAEYERIDDAEHDAAVDDLIALVGAVDGILQAQAEADCRYYLAACGREFDAEQSARIGDLLLRAYRWQYIVSGVQHPRFSKLLAEMTTPAQMQRIVAALAPILGA